MLTLVGSVCIDAPAAHVWAHLAQLEDIAVWSDAVQQARCDGAITRGVGAVRTCQLAGGLMIQEQWVAWEEGSSFTYEGAGLPLIHRARNRWTVLPQGPTKALLTSEAALELKGGWFGRLFEPLLGPPMRRMAPGALAAFKYFVEHGQPYTGKAADLPQAAVTCV